MFQNADEVLKYIKDNDVEFIDVRFTDLPGVQQHFNLPASNFGESAFTEGQMFDGSSIRGFASIHKSDLKLHPGPGHGVRGPVPQGQDDRRSTTRSSSPAPASRTSRDPRQVASKAEAYLKTTGIADTSYFGAEAEFYIFDEVRYETKMNGSFYKVDSDEGAWNTGRDEEGGNLGYKTSVKGGYFPVSPYDHQADLRDEMSTAAHQRGLRARARAPRGRHRRPGRDQLQVQHADPRGRRGAAVQVHHQERCMAQRQVRDVHAEAAVR